MDWSRQDVPAWVGLGLVPALNVALALLVAGCIVVIIGEDPLVALDILLVGAFGSSEAIGYTLYYATNLIFTGLAVAVAFHAGLFNIGGEGQAYMGGLGVALAALALDVHLSGWMLIPLCALSGAVFGAVWGFIPGYLQARRGSHVVITTIMFNFLASALMVYLVVNHLIEPGQMTPESREFAKEAWIPFMHDVLNGLGFTIERSPLNMTFLWALACCVLVWVFLWRTPWGYAIRTTGHNPNAAAYAGISPARVTILAMALAGGLAGFLGLNEVLGVQHRLQLEFTAGYGFTGIAVALMGRNHPVGIVFAAILFGVLYQGGAELAFEIPALTRDMVVVIQGLVILFCGALEHMIRPGVESSYRRLFGTRSEALRS